MNPLESARHFWKVFDLNNSENSGMRITENGKVSNSYGDVISTDGMVAFSPVVDTRLLSDGSGDITGCNQRTVKRRAR